MTRFSRTPETPTDSSQGRLALSGSIALLLVVAGLTNLGMAGTNDAVVGSSFSFDFQDDEPITREDYGRIQGEMERAVKSGWLSREEMKTKLGELRGRIAPGESKGDGTAKSFTRSDYARAQKELDGLVAEGKVSREDADGRLNRMRKAIDSNEPAKEFTREEYASAEAKIKKMVAEGKVSPEDARRRLGEMRQAIGRNETAKSFTRSDYARVKKELDGMVAEGKVSREDAGKRLDRMRQAIGSEQSVQTSSRDGYARRAEAIEKKVAEGEISREDADRMHGELRRRLAAGQRGQGGEGGKRGQRGEGRKGGQGVEPRFISEEEYNRVEAELKELVAAGELSKEDAQRKLVAMQNTNKKAHIEASVKSGEMTRAEADKLYKELGYK